MLTVMHFPQSRRRSLHLPALLLTILLLAPWRPAPLSAADQPSPWVIPPQETLLHVIPPPPAPGSAAEQADLDGVMALQDHPTKQELAHAEQSVAFSVFTFAETLGPEFNAKRKPRTALFFSQLEATANQAKNFLKETYRRDRPFVAFPSEVRPLVTPEAGYSYPSGHCTRSWLFALVLAELDPPHRASFFRNAIQVGEDRIIGGMHFPTDMMESRVLAVELHRCLMKDPDFRRDLEQLRSSEWSDGKSPAASVSKTE